MAAQQLRLHASTAEVRVQSLVEDLRSHMPQGMAKLKIERIRSNEGEETDNNKIDAGSRAPNINQIGRHFRTAMQ